MAVASEIVEDAENVVLGVTETCVSGTLFVYIFQNRDDHLFIYSSANLVQGALLTNERKNVAVETIADLGIEVRVDALGLLVILV